MVASELRNAYPTRRRHGLQPCRNIDAISEYRVVLHNDIPDVQPHPQKHLLVFTVGRVQGPVSLLDFHRASRSLHDAGKLGQYAVAASPGDPPATLFNKGVYDFP